MGYIASIRSSIHERSWDGQERPGSLSPKITFSANQSTVFDINAHNKG